ncbi:MAG TPA: ATP-binding protein [Gammaproteobacteria bacterium]|jgi:signal transduction histidine kinase
MSHGDLFARLQQLCAAFRSSAGIDCRFAVDPAHTRFDAVIGEVLFRAVRELLTNVRKHARAQKAELSSTVLEDGSIVFTLRDDGIGMGATDGNDPRFDNGGLGLWSIDLHLREIGAFMEIESDSGVCASIVLPGKLVAGEPQSP